VRATPRTSLTSTLPESPVPIHADPTRLSQAVDNLLNNACKFTNPGGRIAVALEADGGEAAVRVSDNGAGIASEQCRMRST